MLILVSIFLGSNDDRSTGNKHTETKKETKVEEYDTRSKHTETPKEVKVEDYDTGITYEQLNRRPDDFIGKKVSFSGTVVQVVESENDDGMAAIRLSVNDNPNDIIYCAYNKQLVSERILDGDYLTVYGEFYGIQHYNSTMGAPISIPGINVDKISN